MIVVDNGILGDVYSASRREKSILSVIPHPLRTKLWGGKRLISENKSWKDTWMEVILVADQTLNEREI